MTAIVLCTINAKWIHPSLALRLLKANLPPILAASENSVILEFALRQRLEEKAARVLAEKPKILALSVSIWNHEAILELLQALETKWAGIGIKPTVILGGPEVTPLPPEAPLFSHADFIIRGEGELVFGGLCTDILKNTADAKKQYGKFIAANSVDLSKIKNGYDLYGEEDLQKKLIYVESSRGCPYACAFCQSAVKNSQGRASSFSRTPSGICEFPPVREFPLEPFFGNLEKLLERSGKKTRTIKFLDRSFNINVQRTLRILEFCLSKITKQKNEAGVNEYKNGFQFHFEMVPSVFPAALRNMLAMFPPGTIRLEIGIQSLNPRTCALIHRTDSPEEILNVLRFLREKTNAVLHADLIAGLPAEDTASFANGFDRLWAALSASNNSAPFEIQLGILKVLPGTPIHAMAEEGSFSVHYNKAPPYEVIETDCVPINDMEKIKNFARFWEQIVNRRSFPGLLPALVPAGKPVFARFMELSQKLIECFGKNWGIPKSELEETVNANLSRSLH